MLNRESMIFRLLITMNRMGGIMDDLEALQFLDDQYTVMLLVDLLRNPGLSITELGNIRGKRASPAKFNRL